MSNPSTSIADELNQDIPTENYLKSTLRSLAEIRELRYWAHLTSLCTISGLVLGTVQGTRLASLQYTAEQSHKRPSSKTGWFLYHRRKNYFAFLKGIRMHGLPMGARFGSVCGLLFAGDVLLDMYRHRISVWHSMVSGCGTALIFSVVQRLPVTMAVKAVGAGSILGLGYGGSVNLAMWTEGLAFNYQEKYQMLLSKKPIDDPQEE